MSRVDDSVYVQLRREEHLEGWHKAKQSVARSRGVDPDDLSRPDIVEQLLETHELTRLEADQRIKEARQVVAKDHNMDPDDVTLQALLKITASAYCGYQQTSDWRPEDGEKV